MLVIVDKAVFSPFVMSLGCVVQTAQFLGGPTHMPASVLDTSGWQQQLLHEGLDGFEASS